MANQQSVIQLLPARAVELAAFLPATLPVATTAPALKEAVPQSIDGVLAIRLDMHQDARGAFTEVFRRQWVEHIDPIQWNVVCSRSGVMRGMHVHIRHADYFLLISGRVLVGLFDMRRGSRTERHSSVTELCDDDPTALWIPPGVAHGFYFPETSTHLYSMTDYWNPAEEMGCHWQDPDLKLDWRIDREPIVSPRDADLGSLKALFEQFEPYQTLASAS